MAYKKGTHIEVQLCRFYAPRFWPGIAPEGEDQETLKPDYPFFFKKDEWNEDEIFGLFEPDNATNLQTLIRSSVNAGKLTPLRLEPSTNHRIGDIYYFRPLEIIGWAIGKGLKLATELLDWYKHESYKANDELHQSLSIEDLTLPPETDEERLRWHEDFKKKQDENREKEIERSRVMLEQNNLIRDYKQQQYKEMLIEVQLEATRRIEAEKHATPSRQQGESKQVTHLMPADTQPQAEADDEEFTGRRDKQVVLICETANSLGYPDLLKIPEGGKSAIKAECLKITQWFTKDGFKKAWIVAGNRNLIRMKDKEKYLKNQ